MLVRDAIQRQLSNVHDPAMVTHLVETDATIVYLKVVVVLVVAIVRETSRCSTRLWREDSFAWRDFAAGETELGVGTARAV